MNNRQFFYFSAIASDYSYNITSVILTIFVTPKTRIAQPTEVYLTSTPPSTSKTSPISLKTLKFTTGYWPNLKKVVKFNRKFPGFAVLTYN